MDSWHATFLGLRHLPREVTAFEVEVFFQFSAEEARIIEDRRRPELKLGLALQIGFLRMSGRLLDAVRIVPPLLWRHLGERLGVAAPDLASLRAMYRRAPTLIEHQQVACDALGFQWLTDHHRRALVRVLREELTRTNDRERLLGFARRWLPRQITPVDIPEADKACSCCGARMKCIGVDSSEHLGYEPATIRILVTERKKYACESCHGEVKRAAAPHDQPLAKSMADALGVTSDYLLDGAADEAAKARFEDRELLKQFQEVEQLPDEDKNVVKKLLDAFLTKKQLQALAR